MNLHDCLMSRPESSGPSRRLTPSIPQQTGIGDEVIITLVFASMGWDIQTLCNLSLVSHRMKALAGRILWRQVCLNRAPKMSFFLTEGWLNNRILGGWKALAKLMFYCVGCKPTLRFDLGCPLPGHFATSARFSMTSGRNFVSRRCHGDELFVSNVCEHQNPEGPLRSGLPSAGPFRDVGPILDDIGPELCVAEVPRDELFVSNVCEHQNPEGQGIRRGLNLGVYRGVYRSFENSRTRRILLRMDTGFVEEFRCTFCRARMWSMTEAGLIPSKRAAKWLSTRNGRLEYYVCVNGHLHGACWLLRVAQEGEVSDEANTDEDDFMNSGDDDDYEDVEEEV